MLEEERQHMRVVPASGIEMNGHVTLDMHSRAMLAIEIMRHASEGGDCRIAQEGPIEGDIVVRESVMILLRS